MEPHLGQPLSHPGGWTNQQELHCVVLECCSFFVASYPAISLVHRLVLRSDKSWVEAWERYPVIPLTTFFQEKCLFFLQVIRVIENKLGLLDMRLHVGM